MHAVALTGIGAPNCLNRFSLSENIFSFLQSVTSSNQLSRSSVGSATKVRTAYRGRRKEMKEGRRKEVKRQKEEVNKQIKKEGDK